MLVSNLMFVASLALFCSAMLTLGCKFLPLERWQVLAAVPVQLQNDGQWQGVNFTYYGFLTANAYVMAIVMLLVLLQSIGVALGTLLVLACALLCACVPASRIVATMVEGKAHTFTVGGAVFVGIIIAPLLITIINTVTEAGSLPTLPTLAALGVAYAIGEGLGRLACISFGCCYGKPIHQCGTLGQAVFSRFNLIFYGKTKKISYASGLMGQPVVPVQALTAILYVVAALMGTLFFLYGNYRIAFLLTALVTQGWRIYSETLRADYRGDRSFSVYQWMGIIAMIYVMIVSAMLTSVPGDLPQIAMGVKSLWNPLVILTLQGVWLLLFWYTGKSSVTGSTLSFYVHSGRI